MGRGQGACYCEHSSNRQHQVGCPKSCGSTCGAASCASELTSPILYADKGANFLSFPMHSATELSILHMHGLLRQGVLHVQANSRHQNSAEQDHQTVTVLYLYLLKHKKVLLAVFLPAVAQKALPNVSSLTSLAHHCCLAVPGLIFQNHTCAELSTALLQSNL